MSREPDIESPNVLTREMLAELEGLICQRLCGRLRNFRLSIRKAGLVLSGNTQSHHTKQLAQHALMEMTQTPIVSSEIQVRGSPGLAIPDAVVAVEDSRHPANDESTSAPAAVEFFSRPGSAAGRNS